MNIIRDQHNLTTAQPACVATLGNFDGVHLGHQAVLKSLLENAKMRGLPATVITSEPLSNEYFMPDKAPPRLTRFREKLVLFKQLGIEQVYCQRFNARLANMPAQDFVERILVNGLGVKHLIVGDDTRFGHKRAGDFQLLQNMGAIHGFSVQNTQTLTDDVLRISSTRIREHLQNGEMDAAAHLLGRPYHMAGRVAHGDKRGRELGYPTANIHLKRRQTPVMGIFAVTVSGIDAQALPGVASIGVRPTFGGGQCLLEVHLFDFQRDIYGRHVEVHFLHKLRDEQYFASIPALITQMDEDSRQARAFHQQHLLTRTQ
ncbi:MAG: bifunctional riboflavin kinase/FAD synthetase [Gammaproteobacteria bacterium]|nr:bifunctional riboflavin kinase/FAD synthetase [Gammaproteobacteria bacterium]